MAHPSITDTQRNILRHALGLNYLPEPFRNCFAADPESVDWRDLQTLVTLGAMVAGRAIDGGLQYFHVTDVGRLRVQRDDG